jgi:hypothetical protein
VVRPCQRADVPADGRALEEVEPCDDDEPSVDGVVEAV